MFIVGLSLAAEKKTVMNYSIPIKRDMVSVDEDGTVKWMAPKDEAVKSILMTLAQMNQDNNNLKQVNAQLLEAVNSNKGCLDVVRKYLIAKSPAPKDQLPEGMTKETAKEVKKAMTPDEKKFVDAGKKEVLKK